MLNRIFSLLRTGGASVPATGFVYVSDVKPGPMRDARVGAKISIEGRGPPWIGIHHDPASAIVANWPGRLWRVRILEAATECDQRAFGGPLASHARSTRCISIVIDAEEDVATLFGRYGAGVVRVLEKASQLSHAKAEALAGSRHPDAASAHNRVWRNWLRHEGMTDEHYRHFDGMWEMNVGQKWGSPINNGLSVLHGTVFKRAQDIDGDAATESDEEDIWLVHLWNVANRVLGDAALAFGAPDFMEDEDRAILLSGWSKVFGDG